MADRWPSTKHAPAKIVVAAAVAVVVVAADAGAVTVEAAADAVATNRDLALAANPATKEGRGYTAFFFARHNGVSV